MRRLAALIIGVATAQPVQNYYGNADPHLERRRLAKRVPGSSTAAITEQLLCAAADTRGRPVHEPDELLLRPRAPSLRGSDDDCVDDEDWSYTTKEGDVFTCDRIAEKLKRCTIRFSEDGVRADEACKKTCGTCP